MDNKSGKKMTDKELYLKTVQNLCNDIEDRFFRMYEDLLLDYVGGADGQLTEKEVMKIIREQIESFMR